MFGSDTKQEGRLKKMLVTTVPGKIMMNNFEKDL
jgi:hypothetical protein